VTADRRAATLARPDGHGRLGATANLANPVNPLRRRPLRAALSLALAAAFALAGAFLYEAAGHKVSILAVRRPVGAGQPIQPSDLVVTRITRSASLSPVPASWEAQVVGRRAGVGLTPGELLTKGALASGPVLSSGQAEVGISLRSGELPQGVLGVGDVVEVVLTGSQEQGRGVLGLPGGQVLTTGTLAGPPGVSGSSGDTDVVVAVPRGVAPAVATASAAGRVGLVLLPGQGEGP
jgi:hypothetical protein